MVQKDFFSPNNTSFFILSITFNVGHGFKILYDFFLKVRFFPLGHKNIF